MQSDPWSTKRLLDAVERGDTAAVRSALDQGADANAHRDRSERLPTVQSVATDTLEEITRRETALDLAVRCGHHAVAELLLERGAQATAAALGHAVHALDQALIRRLLDAGADPNALVWTTDQTRVGAVILDADYVTVHVRAPVTRAASRLPDPAPFLLLVAAGGKANEVELGWVLRLAFASRDLGTIGKALDAAERLGIPIAPSTIIGQEPAIVRFVLEHRWRLHPESAAPEQQRAERTRLLMKAAFKYGCALPRSEGGGERPRLLETARDLIAQGADADHFDPERMGDHDAYPLHEALRGLRDLDVEVVKLLLAHGARTTFVYANGRHETAVDIAERSLPPEFRQRMAAILRPSPTPGLLASRERRPPRAPRPVSASSPPAHPAKGPTPPTLVLGRFPLIDSPAQRRIAGALVTALTGPLRETFWLAEAPVLHYPLPLTPQSRDDVREVDEIVPCLCAWERFLHPEAPGPGPHGTVPTWVCEVDDDEDDIEARLALHARAGVRRAWRIDPVTRSLSAFVLGPGNRFQEVAAQCSGGEWRLPPFEAVPIAAASLWEP